MNVANPLLVLIVADGPANATEIPIGIRFPDVTVGVEDTVGQERRKFALEKLNVVRLSQAQVGVGAHV